MTWTVCFWGLLLTRLRRWDGSRAGFSALARGLTPPLICLIAACALYALSLRLYPLAGLTLGLYQFDTIQPAALPGRFLELAHQSFALFITPQGFLSPWLTGLLFCAAAAGACAILSRVARQKRGRHARTCLVAIGLALFPLAAESQFLVSSSAGWHFFRFLALGVSYLYAFLLLSLLMDGRRLARNIGFALFVLIFPCMSVNCLDQQIRHVRSVEHDQAVLNRVLARIETLPEYDPDKMYNLVQFGRTKPYLADSAGAEPLRGVTVSQAWHPGYELRMLSKYLKLGDRLNEEVRLRPDLMEKAIAWAHGRRAFPHRDSIGIVDDTIVLLFEREGIRRAEAKLRQTDGAERKANAH